MDNKTKFKKKRVSKKNKKSWRKCIDTKDIDAFLDDKRLEERLGGPLCKKPDSDIFQVDNEPRTENLTKEKILARKREKFLRPYKCLQALLPCTAVPDPISKRNKGKPDEERKSPFVREMEEKKILAGRGRTKILTALKDRHLADKKRKERCKRPEFSKDLWADTPDAASTSDDVVWLRKDVYLHMLNNTGNRRKTKPKTMSLKTSVLPSIEAPHAGTSYNPSIEEHKELLSKVVEDELKLIKEEEHLDRVVTNMIPKVTLEEVQNNWMNEMSQGLPQFEKQKGDGDSGVEDGGDNDGEIVGNPIVTREKKKTLQKRRKIKEAKAEAIRRREAKTEKKKYSDIERLKLVNQELTKKEEKLEALRKKREKVKTAKIGQPKVLSRYKFEPREMEFNMRTDLSGNLRNIKPEGSILKDRFKRLQERNMVETRTRQTRKLKYKRKLIERPGHKMDWETKGF